MGYVGLNGAENIRLPDHVSTHMHVVSTDVIVRTGTSPVGKFSHSLTRRLSNFITPPDWRTLLELATDLQESKAGGRSLEIEFQRHVLLRLSKAQEHALPKLIDACVDAPPF